MAEKKKKSKAKFVADMPWKHVKSVGRGDRLVFRLPNGRLSKPDARKNLIIEIWRGNHRTNFTLNRTKKGLPLPQKFKSSTIKNYINMQKARSARPVGAPLSETIKVDTRFTIFDNIRQKAKKTLNRVVSNTKKDFTSIISMSAETTKIINGVKSTFFFSPTPRVIKSTDKDYISEVLARGIIYEMYRNDLRASGIKKTTAKSTQYTRSFKITFETGAIK